MTPDDRRCPSTHLRARGPHLLVEALPYIQALLRLGRRRQVRRERDRLVRTNAWRASLASFAEDVVLLRSVGVLPVVVHGGGPQIGELTQTSRRCSPSSVDGLRVTDAETLEIARMVLVGKVNREIVSAINVHGGLAVGLSGEDANLIRAVPHGSGLGFVGDVEVLDTTIVTRLLGDGLIPVVATIGTDASGQAYNINADSVAGALAVCARGREARVPHRRRGPSHGFRPTRHRSRPGSASHEIEALISSGAVHSGMIPKARACIGAVRSGVRRAHVLDGRTPHALALGAAHRPGGRNDGDARPGAGSASPPVPGHRPFGTHAHILQSRRSSS